MHSNSILNLTYGIFWSAILLLCASTTAVEKQWNGLAGFENTVKDAVLNKHISRKAFVGQSVCMEDLGCFVVDSDFFHLKYRPINMLPQSRDRINTRFYLFTREQQNEKHVLRAKRKSSITSSTFKPERQTKIIVHGWLDTQLFGKWMVDMKQHLLAHGDYNVIVVDWSDGNTLPYTQATANTRVVGAEIALLIQYLTNVTGLKEEDCHIIGHSLGAHAAGYAGKKLKNLGRISGLDPAEPYFQYMPPKVRLDRTDAQFVDIIHSDSDSILLMGLGMRQAIGHVDFYPNNARKQPGCTVSKITSLFLDGLAEGIRRIVACDHQRAVDFFHASIGLRRCEFVANRCPSWEIFNSGGCIGCGIKGERCAVMGMKAIEYKPFIKKNESITMYLKTGGDRPFCLNRYQVEVQVANVKGAKEVQGSMQLTLHGSNLDMNSKGLTLRLDVPNTVFHPGSHYRYIVTETQDVGGIMWVTFQWKGKSGFFNLLGMFQSPRIYIKGIRITPLNIIDKVKRAEETKYICGSLEDPIKSGESIVLRSRKDCQ